MFLKWTYLPDFTLPVQQDLGSAELLCKIWWGVGFSIIMWDRLNVLNKSHLQIKFIAQQKCYKQSVLFPRGFVRGDVWHSKILMSAFTNWPLARLGRSHQNLLLCLAHTVVDHDIMIHTYNMLYQLLCTCRRKVPNMRHFLNYMIRY